jgi:hypothetical protein
MAKYPVKMLKDEQNQPFVPLVSAESIYTNDDLSFEEKFATKLEADNLKEGNGIILEQNGNDTTISVDFGATDNIIDNLNTTVAGQGPLDARQGSVLKNMIPVIVDNLDSTDATKVLSANQGHELKEMSVPTGGATGQVLKKASNNDHELEWGDAADPNAIVGDGTIMSIVELTYANYKTLEAAGELKADTEYHITDVENGTTSYMTEEQIINIAAEQANQQFQELYPIGSVIYNNTNTNPGTYLGYGAWELGRTFYGGELIGYALVELDSVGTVQTSGVDYAFSDPSVGTKKYTVENYVPNILTGGSGAILVTPQNIAGFIEATVYISGLGTSGLRGFWWGAANWNDLPSGVHIFGNSRAPLLTGPIDANYGGNSCTYFYKIDEGVTDTFFINPQYRPYNGSFTPGQGGVGCKMYVKAFARAGTTYTWTRIS